MIKNLKYSSIILGIVNIILLFLEHFRCINLYYDFVSAILFLFNVIFLLTLLLYFVLSDIKFNKFKFLKSLNYIATIVGIFTFIKLGLILRTPWYSVYVAYTLLFIFSNNILMTIIYGIYKTGQKYIIDQWLLLFISIMLYLFLPKLFVYFGLLKPYINPYE